jgi:hypothetical protein
MSCVNMRLHPSSEDMSPSLAVCISRVREHVLLTCWRHLSPLHLFTCHRNTTDRVLSKSILGPCQLSSILHSHKLPVLPNMESHERARELKQKVLDNCAILHPRHECANAEERREEDPETSLIKRLREKGTKWEIIANVLNQMHDKNDTTETWTPTHVYSRFMSSTTATASTAKEIGFDTKDYAYLHDSGDAERSQAGRKRVKNCANATELAANVRSPGEVEEQREELQTSEMTTQLMAAVAVVDRNFWTLVADELEKRTARCRVQLVDG